MKIPLPPDWLFTIALLLITRVCFFSLHINFILERKSIVISLINRFLIRHSTIEVSIYYNNIM